MVKINCVLVNVEWLHGLLECIANFLLVCTSDHSPVLIEWCEKIKKNLPFRFNNSWSLANGYRELMEKEWQLDINGDPMFRISSKLKYIGKFKVLGKEKSNKPSERDCRLEG